MTCIKKCDERNQACTTKSNMPSQLLEGIKNPTLTLWVLLESAHSKYPQCMSLWRSNKSTKIIIKYPRSKFLYFNNWATSWQNQQNDFCAQRRLRSAWHSLISTVVVRCLDSMISRVSILAISWLKLSSLAEQTGLSLTRLKIPKTGFLVMRLKCNMQTTKRQISIPIWIFSWCGSIASKKKKTSRPKGDDCSPESQHPQKGFFFQQFRAGCPKQICSRAGKWSCWVIVVSA